MKNSAFLKIMMGATAAIATCAMAASPAETISVRQANYKQIGKAMRAIGEELKKPEPAVAVVQSSAATIAGLAPHVPTWFPAGSGPEAGVKTGALPAIWEKKAEFKTAAANFAAASKGLVTAAATGDLAQIKPAVGALGGTCKGCHESFRAKDD